MSLLTESPAQQIIPRSGLASRDDLDSEIWRRTFEKLELEQREFLAREEGFRSREYLRKWPSDALHWWSRQWEYPYVYGRLTEFVQRREPARIVDASIVDVGSGVTFFPFSVARLGARVICIDTDPVVIADLEKTIRIVKPSPGEVKPKLSSGDQLEIPSEAVDAVYSISVLEHVLNFEPLVRDMYRVLRPGGLCVLTVDVDLRGDSEIGPTKFAELQSLLSELFEYAMADRTIHPLRLLDSTMGPYAMRRSTVVDSVLFVAKSLVTGQASRTTFKTILTRPHLAICGFVLRKRMQEDRM